MSSDAAGSVKRLVPTGPSASRRQQRPDSVGRRGEKLGSARLGCLVSKLRAQAGWVNPEKNQIPLTAVHRVRGKVRLLGPRQMDETVTRKRRWSVLANTLRVMPIGFPRNMNDQATH